MLQRRMYFQFLRRKRDGRITEHVLWADWTYHGLLAASSACTVACLDSHAFEHLTKSQPFQTSLPGYASEFVQHVNSQSLVERTDLMDYETVIDIVHKAAPHFKPQRGKRAKQVFGW